MQELYHVKSDMEYLLDIDVQQKTSGTRKGFVYGFVSNCKNKRF